MSYSLNFSFPRGTDLTLTLEGHKKMSDVKDLLSPYFGNIDRHSISLSYTRLLLDDETVQFIYEFVARAVDIGCGNRILAAEIQSSPDNSLEGPAMNEAGMGKRMQRCLAMVLLNGHDKKKTKK